jgi:hypothetical protein
MLSAGLTAFVAGCQDLPRDQADLLAGIQATAKPPELQDPPAWMTVGCPELTKLPEKEAVQQEVEGYWGGDEEVYKKCRIKHAALRNFYRRRDAALRKQAVGGP